MSPRLIPPAIGHPQHAADIARLGFVEEVVLNILGQDLPFGSDGAAQVGEHVTDSGPDVRHHSTPLHVPRCTLHAT